MKLNNLTKLNQKNFFNIFSILLIGFILRLYYLFTKTGNIFQANLGGDSCYHFNVALNISQGIGPKTSFIFSYWFSHKSIPAVTDLYGPGYHYFLSLFLLIKDEFISLRISSIIVGMLSIVLAYLIGKKLKSKILGVISAIFICINFFHIENSTVVMRENFNLLLVQLFFINLFYLNQNKFLFASIGFIIGFTAITSGIWIVMLIILTLYVFINFQINNIKIYFNFFIVGIFFLITIFPWAKMTHDYFGKILFNYMSFYPYVDDWGLMMSERGLPDIKNFWLNLNFKDYLEKHFFWGISNLYKFSLVLFPTFMFPLFFTFIPIILIGTYKLKSNGYLLLSFTVLYFLALLFGSYGTKGILWSRHFMPFLATTSILMSYGLIVIYFRLKKIKILYQYLQFFINKKSFKFLVLIPILITIFGIHMKESFWERDSIHFYEFGKKIQKKTSLKDRIFYANTVPDGWCVTKREIVQDPAFYKKETSSRILEEAKRFDVDYLLIDVSQHIYQRGSNLNNAIKFYNKLKLKKILEDKVNGFYFYKILN